MSGIHGKDNILLVSVPMPMFNVHSTLEIGERLKAALLFRQWLGSYQKKVAKLHREAHRRTAILPIIQAFLFAVLKRPIAKWLLQEN